MHKQQVFAGRALGGPVHLQPPAHGACHDPSICGLYDGTGRILRPAITGNDFNINRFLPADVRQEPWKAIGFIQCWYDNGEVW